MCGLSINFSAIILDEKSAGDKSMFEIEAGADNRVIGAAMHTHRVVPVFSNEEKKKYGLD